MTSIAPESQQTIRQQVLAMLSYQPTHVKWWIQIAATLGICLVIGFGIALFITLFNKGYRFLPVFRNVMPVSLCVGFSIHGAMYLAHALVGVERVARMQGLGRLLFFLGIPLGASLLGYTLAFWIQGGSYVAMLSRLDRGTWGALLMTLLICGIWYVYSEARTRSFQLEAQHAQRELELQRAEQQAKAAELAALQAQIEPHFLFNTLANVQALIDYDAPKAKAMLESFIEYLRGTLDASRRTHSTLAEEFELVRRFLSLMQVRMGERLRFDIALPAELAKLEFAPLLLQPLVENAIKYGLEPKVQGGTIVLSAHREAGQIVIGVEDDGCGLGGSSTARKGAGMGLQNVRGRLKALFGASATLELVARAQEAGGGARAQIVFDEIRPT